MLPKIKKVEPLENLKLKIEFDDHCIVIYDVMEDINAIPTYKDLLNKTGLFYQVKVDASRTVVYWNKFIDLPSDTLYEYGEKIS